MNKLRDERELLSKPGDTISETLEYLKMTQVELAERMGKTPSKINDIISGKEPLTVSTAFQLEKVFGIDAQFWLNREILYRVNLSRIEQDEALEECKEWLKIQPIKQLKECGYLKSEKIGPRMVEECLKFYGVASPNQWESIYVNQYVYGSYRKSTAVKSSLGGIASWLRIGEIEMQKLNLKPYDKTLFKQNLIKIKDLIRPHPEDFAFRLQEYCLDSGVGLIYTICIPNAPVSGVARWIGGNPLIQLTDRYKTNDQFWFTFFHEVGHILLHGKKDMFIENLENNETNNEKEKEANEFANKNLLPEDITNDLPEIITEREIRAIARSNKTHPAIVLGHLQHLQIVPFNFGNSLKLKVILSEATQKNEED